MGTVLLALATGLVAVVGLPASPASSAVAPTPGARLHGGDISWPNCPEGLGIPSRRTEGQPMPLTTASFVIIGLTNGPGFHPNPCLADQVAWARGRGLWTGAYAMTTFPTRRQLATHGETGPWLSGDRVAALRNTGYQQATFNVASMQQAGLDVPLVWVDVEPYPTHPWSRDRLANREVIRGVVRGYEDSGFRVGFYSYDGGWRAVVGGWRKPAYPTWYPVGPEPDGFRQAAARCRLPSFSGGPVLLGQWVDGNRDRNVTCPRLHGRAARPHPLTALLGSALARGDSGRAVTTLQRGMNMRPRYVDGEFGPRTERVLLAFQRIRSLPLTGVATDVELTALGAGTVRPGRPARLAGFFTAY
ncbi:MAG: peptidoglycan-binding protein [Actinomycetes bacterium]